MKTKTKICMTILGIALCMVSQTSMAQTVSGDPNGVSIEKPDSPSIDTPDRDVKPSGNHFGVGVEKGIGKVDVTIGVDPVGREKSIGVTVGGKY